MKIGIVNLPLDNNYGGNLQRYALIRTLQKMGHNPEHILLKFGHEVSLFKRMILFVENLIFLLVKGLINAFSHKQCIPNKNSMDAIVPFYNKYIPHSSPCYSETIKKNVGKYDCFIFGSDQIWRKSIAKKYMKLMFGSFLPPSVKRIAYAVSLGSDTNELSSEEIIDLGKLYKKFSAVSLRENSGIELVKQYGWNTPKPIHLLDPTFLIDKEEYQEIIKTNKTIPSKGSLFCYILDYTEEKESIIKRTASNLDLVPYVVSLGDTTSIPQWLREFDDAEFIITDSYHGLVFSIIFNKPYKLIRNSFRGNARFDSLLQDFGLSDCEMKIDNEKIKKIIDNHRYMSMKFLQESLA